MKLSDKKKTELYAACAAQIMDLRVELKMNPHLSEEKVMDERLFKLEKDIWADVKKALNFDG